MFDFGFVVLLLLGALLSLFAGVGTRLLVGKSEAVDRLKTVLMLASVVVALLMALVAYTVFEVKAQLIVALVVMVGLAFFGALFTGGKERKMAVRSVYGMAATLLLGVGYLMATSSHGGPVPLMHAKVNLSDEKSLQRGAAAFRDYCFSCHGLSAVRYNQLEKLGLSEENIKTYMLTTTTKTGDMMMVGMNAADAKKWFGVTPPDLSLMTSAKGADYVYSYLNGFYKDDTRPTGWNNMYLLNAAMPHVLYEEQGVMQPKMSKVADHKDHSKMVDVLTGVIRVSEGKKDDAAYQQMTNDITNFLYWAAEPDRKSRHMIGYIVLAFLFVFSFLTYRLNKNYWKDIH